MIHAGGDGRQGRKHCGDARHRDLPSVCSVVSEAVRLGLHSTTSEAAKCSPVLYVFIGLVCAVHLGYCYAAPYVVKNRHTYY